MSAYLGMPPDITPSLSFPLWDLKDTSDRVHANSTLLPTPLASPPYKPVTYQCVSLVCSKEKHSNQKWQCRTNQPHQLCLWIRVSKRCVAAENVCGITVQQQKCLPRIVTYIGRQNGTCKEHVPVACANKGQR